MKITNNDVNHVAKLARLGLNNEESLKYEKELNDVLNFMDKLDELDTEGVELVEPVLRSIRDIRILMLCHQPCDILKKLQTESVQIGAFCVAFIDAFLQLV